MALRRRLNMLEVMELEHRIAPTNITSVFTRPITLEIRSPVQIVRDGLQAAITRLDQDNQWMNQMSNGNIDPDVATNLRAMNGEILHAAGLLGQVSALLRISDLNFKTAADSNISIENLTFFATRGHSALAEANRLMGFARTAINDAENFGFKAQTILDYAP
jgi:hypothetical protein